MSEPWAMCNIHNLRARGKITPEESKRLIRSAIRLHCKVEPGSGVQRIFMKMTPMNAPQFGDFGELFPKIHFFFNTRHPIPSLKSIKQVIDAIMHTDQPYYYSWGISWWDQMGLNFNFPYGDKYNHMLKRFNRWRQNIPDDEASVLNYATTMAAYFETKDIYERVILYENLSGNPEREVKAIFEIMGIPEKNVPLALEALKRDSQNGTFGERGKARKTQLEPWLLDKFDEYMKEVFLPQFHQNMSVPEFKKVFGVE